MSNPENIKGPYIVWENYGYDGWQPKSYPDLGTALTSQKYSSEWEITKKVEFEVKETGAVNVKP